MSIGSDTVMTVAPDSHRIPYYLPGKKPFVPYFRYSVKDKYSIKGEEMQEGEKYYENKRLFVNSWGTEKIEKLRQRVRIKNPLIIFDEKKYVECGYGIF